MIRTIGPKMKKCTKCLTNKPIDEFGKLSRNKNGLDAVCLACRRKLNKEYRDNNPELVKAARKKYYHKNIKRMREEKIRNASKPEAKQKKSEYDKIYRAKNKKKISEYKKQWQKQKCNDIEYKIKRNLRRRIHHVVKDGYKSAKTFDLIGCSASDFIRHIESQFREGMSWDNYGVDGWHIDHIIPCYKFDLTKPEEQRKCFHYSNQRPLWAKENLSRSRYT